MRELFLQAKAVSADLAPPTVIAAVSAAVALLLFGWPWRAPRTRRIAVGAVLSVSVGLLAGYWWLGVRPHWPPQEDQDRLLLILFPAVILVEVVAALLKPGILNVKSDAVTHPSLSSSGGGVRLWLPWLPRVAVAAIAARIMLHDSSYIADLSGPGTRQWTPEQTWQILGGLGLALAATWILLAWLSHREPGRTVPLAVAVACCGTAVTMMLSGYASGGPLAMPLAGAVVGALVASLILKGSIPLDGLLGLSVVGLFAVLVMGRFFGELTWTNAGLLFFAPLLCWLGELPPLHRLKPGLRAVAGVALAAAPVVIALALAQQKFVEDSAKTSTNPEEPSLEDYMNFGK
jgi:hypothetical protein